MDGMTRREFSCGALAASAGRPLRMATFRAGVTPALGEPLIWVTPAVEVLDPLWATGVILEDGGGRYVLCAVDWCGLGGSAHLLFRSKLAAAVGTDAARAAVQAVHQHAAPYVDGDASALMRKRPTPPLLMSGRFLEEVTDRLAAAAKDAVARLEPFDRVGAGEAAVERVASARRIFHQGRLLIRYSGGGKDPALAALPEGPVDPLLKTVTLARGAKPLVRLHYYATHPQTFCCDGRVSGDFVGAAREAVEREDGVFQIYFTGGAGDVTVGKYNDGSAAARQALAARLQKGMRAAIAATRFEPATTLRWWSLDVTLPPRPRPPGAAPPAGGEAVYRAAIAEAFAARKTPLALSALELAQVHILHLPGEPMLEFQRFAQRSRPDRFVAVAGYGDMSPGYLCTGRAFEEGGYEPGAANAGPGTEARVKQAIEGLLKR
jgi:hypothetical protein